MRKIIVSTIAIATIFMFNSRNKTIVDTTYTFDKAVLNLGEEYITINVKSWTDYQDSRRVL